MPESVPVFDGGPDGLRRDLGGYRAADPRVDWPNGGRLAVSFVINVEEGAELFLGDGDERNESAYEINELVENAPDLAMSSHFDYGSRRGWNRIRGEFLERGAVATINACGRAVAATPWIAQQAVEDGHEIAAHGWRWERHAGMEENHERDVIARTNQVLAEISGERVRGWHVRSSASVNTRRLLIEQGIEYDSNAYDDDVPVAMTVGGVPHVVLPYGFDTNDMRFFTGHFIRDADFADYCIAAIDQLRLEARTATRMLTIGLHTRIIGRPGRIAGLARVLDHLAGAPEVWIARRDRIADHWRSVADWG